MLINDNTTVIQMKKRIEELEMEAQRLRDIVGPVSPFILDSNCQWKYEEQGDR